MKLVFISGSYPPQICGVGDYTANLVEGSEDQDINVLHITNWKLSNLLKILKIIKKSRCDSIVLQYPTKGYGRSIVPHIVVLFFSLFTPVKTAVAIHEFSNSTKKTRIAASLFSLANILIFTSNIEKDSFNRHYPLTRRKSHVIGIKSNIPAANIIKPITDRPIDIIYFGHISKSKGLNEFIDAASSILEKFPECKIAIVGQVPDGDESIYETLLHRTAGMNIELHRNAPVKEVTELLNNSKIAFLPFPDGVSERRGSFLAAAENGCAVVSFNGKYVTDELKQSVFLTDKTNMVNTLLQVLNKTKDEYLTIQKKNRDYLQHNVFLSWKDMALKYKHIMTSNK